jgi:hypothetical protein
MVQAQIDQFSTWSATGGAWFSPFFTADSRHVFYVTTTGTPPVTVTWSAAGLGPATTAPVRAAGAVIPPLIIAPGPTPRRPGMATRYLIGGCAPVTYNGQAITSSGSVTGDRPAGRSQEAEK